MRACPPSPMTSDARPWDLTASVSIAPGSVVSSPVAFRAPASILCRPVTIAPTHSTKPQYFLSFAVLGSVVPFASVLLAERGLSKAQIGTAWAVQSLAVVVTPIVVTLLADLAVSARVLLVGLFGLAGLSLAGWAGAN